MTKRTLSVLLTICLLLTMMPGTAMANTVSNIPFAQGNAAPTDNEIPLETAPVNKNITVLHEDEALRQEYEKHFLMSDGSYQVALYNEPVHKLESGKWVEIDNTLTLRSTRDGRILPEDVLRHFIDDGHVVLAARDWYVEGQKDGSYAILITGYTTSFKSGELQFRYTINDPWPTNTQVAWESLRNTTGQTYERQYDWICNGKKETNLSLQDNGIWAGFVIVNTDYASTTCAPVMK